MLNYSSSRLLVIAEPLDRAAMRLPTGDPGAVDLVQVERVKTE